MRINKKQRLVIKKKSSKKYRKKKIKIAYSVAFHSNNDYLQKIIPNFFIIVIY